MLDAAHWTERLRDLAGQNAVRGAVLGIWADGQETVAVHGVLNSATGVETTTDSLFQVGSITKVWTATMIMQLIDEGCLALDTTVAQVLPGARICTSDVSGQVTIEHLLTHTSGIEGDVFIDTGRGDDCLERFVARLAEVRSVYPPGEAFSYCNSGFQLLGRIIEVMDGQTWDGALRTRLAAPLGLTRTVTLPDDAIVHRVAAGHDDDGNMISFWTAPRCDGPAGAVTCDAHDLLTFARFHLDGGIGPDGSQVLTEASATAMRQQRVGLPPPPAKVVSSARVL
jgi:CubicO group peptidase (beta-lactamase class C family)